MKTRELWGISFQCGKTEIFSIPYWVFKKAFKDVHKYGYLINKYKGKNSHNPNRSRPGIIESIKDRWFR
jgi:hypothetical protein